MLKCCEFEEELQMSRETWCRYPKCGSGKSDVRDIEVQDNEMILREMRVKWTRDKGICSRYQQIRDMKCSRYCEPTIYLKSIYSKN